MAHVDRHRQRLNLNVIDTRHYSGSLRDLLRNIGLDGDFTKVSFQKANGDGVCFHANILPIYGTNATLVVRRMSDGLHAGLLAGDVERRLQESVGEERKKLIEEIRAVGTDFHASDWWNFRGQVRELLDTARRCYPK